MGWMSMIIESIAWLLNTTQLRNVINSVGGTALLSKIVELRPGMFPPAHP